MTPQKITLWRPATLVDLTEEDLLQLLEFKPKVVLLGTGQTLEFPPVKLWRFFIARPLLFMAAWIGN